jgi:hypothetical protein
MISIHTTVYNPKTDNTWAYAAGWCLPWHPKVEYRGQFTIPVKCDTMEQISHMITEYTWSPIIFKKLYRLEKNFLGSFLCVLDFDDGYMSLAEAIEEFRDYKCVIGTTRSHQVDKKGLCCDRFRVVLVWESTITDIRQYKQNILKWIKKYKTDISCQDGARYMFPCREIVFLNDDGKYIPVEPYVEPQKKKQITFKKSRNVFSKRVQAFFESGLYGSAKERGLNAPSRDYESFFAAREMLEKGYSDCEILSQLKCCTDLSERDLLRKIESAKKHLADKSNLS